MSLIHAENLSKVFNEDESETIALDNVSFSIAAGEFVAIMGPSGSGKSTLLHILGFLDRPSQGQYLFEGKNFSDFSDDELAKLRNQKFGFVFQQFNLLPNATVLENTKLPLLYSDVPEAQWNEQALVAVDKVGLTHRLNHLSQKLSGGEKQRVAMARALVNNPEVIFADEPTGNLDSKTGLSIMSLLKDLNPAGNTIVLVTHDPAMANFADRIIKFKDGKIQESGA